MNESGLLGLEIVGFRALSVSDLGLQRISELRRCTIQDSNTSLGPKATEP